MTRGSIGSRDQMTPAYLLTVFTSHFLGLYMYYKKNQSCTASGKVWLFHSLSMHIIPNDRVSHVDSCESGRSPALSDGQSASLSLAHMCPQALAYHCRSGIMDLQWQGQSWSLAQIHSMSGDNGRLLRSALSMFLSIFSGLIKVTLVVQACLAQQQILAEMLLEHAVPNIEKLVALSYPYRACSHVLDAKPGHGCADISRSLKVSEPSCPASMEPGGSEHSDAQDTLRCG